MVAFSGPPSTAIRNKAITDELKAVIETAAIAAGIDKISITSGGQDALGHGTRRTGSTRHDLGRAADLQCVVGSRTLTFTNTAADPKIVTFVTAAAAAGAVGIGAATDYMGDRTIHVGFGTSPSDTNQLTWGRDGRSAFAPAWLRDAADAGWADPSGVLPAPSPAITGPGRYTVIARSGLRLRGGPGTDFEVEALLPLGTTLTLVALDSDPDWGKVDIEGDGLVDGYVHLGFLAPVSAIASNEFSPEPDDGDNG